MKRMFATLVATAMLLSSLAGCGGGGNNAGSGSNGGGGGAPSGQTKILTIGTADSTGTMYPVGAGVASVINDNVPGFKVNVETSKGSPANCVNIQQNNVDLATIAGDTALQAVEGMGNFEGQSCPDLRALCAVYASLSNWIALKSSGMTMVNELGGKSVVVGPEASTTEISGLAGLAACGVEPGEKVNLGLGDGAEEVSDGVRDASHAFAGVPVGGQLSVAQTKDSVFLAYTDEELDRVIEANPSYYKAVIPAGTYPGQDADVSTFGVKCLIVINVNMDDQMAYDFAKAMTENVDSLIISHASMSAMLDPDFICNDMPIALHPGAEKYYAEAGMLK